MDERENDKPINLTVPKGMLT